MQMRFTKGKRFTLFCLSILLHLLILLAFSVVLVTTPPPMKKPPNYYVPAYSYSSPTAPSQPKMAASPPAKAAEPTPLKADTQEVDSPQKLVAAKQPVKVKDTPHESILASSLRILQENQMKNLSSNKQEEPIFLIGDKNEVADPLIKLLGRALSKNFEYPKMAGEFGIKGRVLMGLTLHPEGFLSDIQMIKSSDNNDLDAAAMRAVNTAPTVVGADRFISKPKYFVIGFIFR